MLKSEYNRISKALYMNNENICRFMPVHNTNDSINVINFVYEKNKSSERKCMLLSSYTVGIVTDGTGNLHCMSNDYTISRGDIFFTFPAKLFSIENTGSLKYMYITFTGLRANRILERLKIGFSEPVLHNYGCLAEHWEKALEILNTDNMDMLSESVLLYTFSYISKGEWQQDNNSDAHDAVLSIKQYIDENFADPNLTLDAVGKKYLYNTKYVSSLFKKNMGIGFSEYLATIRIQNACAMIQQGITSVKDIAMCSGFSDQLYFSRVFKQKMGISPREHIKSMKNTQL